MIRDISTVFWKDWKEVLSAGAGRSRAGYAIFVLIFGILMPLQMGELWFDVPWTVAWVSYILVISVVADSIAGERERHTLETLLASRLSDSAILLGKTAASVAYGFGLGLSCMVLAAAFVNVFHWHGKLMFYRPISAVGTVVFSLLICILAASSGVLVSIRASSVRQAQQTLSLLLMLPLLAVFFGFGVLPKDMQVALLKYFGRLGAAKTMVLAAAALFLIDMVLMYTAFLRFRRSRLILD